MTVRLDRRLREVRLGSAAARHVVACQLRVDVHERRSRTGAISRGGGWLILVVARGKRGEAARFVWVGQLFGAHHDSDLAGSGG
jgi:hypothetical protein